MGKPTPLLGLGSALRPIPHGESNRYSAPGDIVNPSEMVGIGDDETYTQFEIVLTKASDRSTPALASMEVGFKPDAIASRHSGGANLLFLDGHVEYHKRAQWDYEDPNIVRRFNRDNEPHPELW